MSLSAQALIKGLVSRLLPTSNFDSANNDAAIRLGRYGEMAVLPFIRKQHLLVDEGSYFIASTGSQTGQIASPATGWVATTPSLVIFNTDSPGNLGAKRIYLDYLNLVTTVVGSAASALVNLQAALYLDSTNRYVSGGAELTNTTVNPNMDVSVSSKVSKVYFGAITASAATSSVRPVVPLRVIRPAVSATVMDVVGETKWFNFGGVEGALNGSITIANANFITVPMPAVVIGPGQCALLYLWQNVGGTNVAATYAPELGFWER